ncbi:MAG TPA: hypothetical protein VJZ94_02040 [Candidatus Paceibacterota bacterium]|nr:hypothetical protein [Candidatus Paceibacterota bacterium]
MIEKTQIIRYGDEACILFPDKFCKKYDIKVGDDVDVSYNEQRGGLVIKLLK